MKLQSIIKKYYSNIILDYKNIDDNKYIIYINPTKEIYNNEIMYAFNKIKKKKEKIYYISYTKDKSKYEDMKHISNDTNLKDFNIIIDEKFTINDIDKINEIAKNFNNKDNVYIYLYKNIEWISITNLNKVVNYIDKIINRIKGLNLSPMEMIMYTYDLVKKRVYEIGNIDNADCSRTLLSVINGEGIVCSGYINFFNSILERYGINTEHLTLLLKNTKSLHSRSLIYIKDPKYNIDGVYYFDPTWDDRLVEDEKYYNLRYAYFAKTEAQMNETGIRNNEIFKYQKNFEPLKRDCININIFEEINDYTLYINAYEKIEELFKKNNTKLFKTKYKKIINNMLTLTGQENVTNLDSSKLEIIKNTLNKFNKPISAETMLKLLNSVRKIQVSIDPSTIYSENEMYLALCYALWKFDNNHNTSKTNNIDENLRDNFLNFIIENNIDCNLKNQINEEEGKYLRKKNDWLYEIDLDIDEINESDKSFVKRR